MKMSIRRILIGAALLAGCNGTIGGQGGTGSPTGNPTGTPTGTPTGVSTGTGNSGVNPTGAGGSGVVAPPTTCTPGVPTTSQLPRLTRIEYDNTTKDLLGLDVQPSSMLAPDTTGAVDQRAWDGFQAAADALAAQVLASPTAKAKVIPCTADTAACAQQFVTTFGQKAFRRPLTTAEVTKFTNFYTNKATLTQNGTLDQAFQLIIKAFLLSPSFLTKAEISEATPSGANYALSGYEMASRLSYMLWGTMPDDVLFAEAAANRLSTQAQILGQAQRMIMDPRARTRVGEFHASYMLMTEASRWTEAAHDATKFPAFKASMVPMLAESTKRFFDYVTFDPAGGGRFQDLILKPVAFVNRDLAPIYGLTSTATDYTLATLDQAQRAGALTQAGFLASFSSFDRTSPILRGAFIEKNVLCRTIGSPPPDAAATPLPTTGNTNRERVTAQTSAGACAGCHATVVNPPGFALEAYDSIGMWQTTEKGTSFAIDTAADVAIGAATVKVAGPVDLMQKIAASPEGQSCYAQRWVQFAYERDLTSQDVCTVQTIQTKMAGTGYTILSLVTDLTQSESFRLRAKELP
jgi:hypothetical protein